MDEPWPTAATAHPIQLPPRDHAVRRPLPPALEVARALSGLMEAWAVLLVEKVGLIKDDSQAQG